MVKLKLLLMNIKRNFSRYLFTTIGLMTGIIILVFSYSFKSSILGNIESRQLLFDNQMHVFYDESRFEEINVNFYERLKEEFYFVQPFMINNYEIKYNDEFYNLNVQGTNIENSRLDMYYEENFYNNHLISGTYFLNSDDVVINEYMSEQFFQGNSLGKSIEINNNTFKVVGVVSDVQEENFVAFISYLDFANKLQPSRVIDTGNIVKYEFDRYLISSLSEITDNDINMVKNIYMDPDYSDNPYINTRQYEIDTLLQEEFPYKNFITLFFVLIAIFSSLNVFNTLIFNLYDRHKENAIFLVLGLSPKRLKRYIIYELTLVGVFSSILAMVIGISLSAILIPLKFNFDFVMPNLSTLLLISFITPVLMLIYGYLIINFKNNKNIILNIK